MKKKEKKKYNLKYLRVVKKHEKERINKLEGVYLFNINFL